jgi:hypothetical protein
LWSVFCWCFFPAFKHIIWRNFTILHKRWIVFLL